MLNYIVLISISSWIVYTDLKEKIIPDMANLLLLLYGFFISYPDIKKSFLGILLGLALMLLVSLAGPIGGGDVKLMAALGSWFGLRIIDVFLLSYIIGLGFALIYYLKYRNFKQEVPFAPSIVLSAILIYTTKISLIHETIETFLQTI